MSNYLTKGFDASDLLPCPFCGGEAEWRDGSSTKPYIRCKECGMRTGGSSACDKLKAAWNRRPDVSDETCCIRGGECDQCGAIIHKQANTYWVPTGEGLRTVECHDVHYCPNCGARVVDG